MDVRTHVVLRIREKPIELIYTIMRYHLCMDTDVSESQNQEKHAFKVFIVPVSRDYSA